MSVEEVEITVFQDGENASPEREAIEAAIIKTWRKYYDKSASLRIRVGCVNLKEHPEAARSLPKLSKIYDVRNPDIYFVAKHGDKFTELGGVEITTHSPDGSNVDKRYPFLWAAGQWPINAFVATPYMKQRPNGQQNCLPHRHASRNRTFLDAWNPSEADQSILRQIIPIRELQLGAGRRLPESVAEALFSWNDLGEFFAHDAAAKLLGGPQQNAARRDLALQKAKLAMLVAACLANTTNTEPTSLIVQPRRWIQIYNTRPETGHWERGEGQFDSIDGRLMFTADGLAEIIPAQRPSLEFWLPQMTSQHPWIAAQRARNYGSKRLRNLLVVLASVCTTKFADELSSADWDLLRANRQVLLERLDWPEGVYKVADFARGGDISRIARQGLISPDHVVVGDIEAHLGDGRLYYASYRPYSETWGELLYEAVRGLPRDGRVLVTRIPRQLLSPLSARVRCSLVSAEDCTKSELMTIRQLDRDRHHPARRGGRARHR